MKSSVINTDFGTLDFLEMGSGTQSILLLHACGAGAKPLQKLATALTSENDYRIVIPNLIGYGRSRHNDETLPPIQQHLALIEYLLKLNKNQRWRIIGHSMGGFLALQTALYWPQQVRSVSAIEPMAFGVLDPVNNTSDAGALNEDRQLIIALDQALLTGQPEQGLAGFISYWNGVPWSQLPEMMREQLLRLSRQIHAEANAVSYDTTSANTYAQLEMPIQLLLSEHAPLPAWRIVERLCEIIPQAQMQRIDGVGHMGLLTHPDHFARPIRNFLDC